MSRSTRVSREATQARIREAAAAYIAAERRYGPPPSQVMKPANDRQSWRDEFDDDDDEQLKQTPLPPIPDFVLLKGWAEAIAACHFSALRGITCLVLILLLLGYSCLFCFDIWQLAAEERRQYMVKAAGCAKKFLEHNCTTEHITCWAHATSKCGKLQVCRDRNLLSLGWTKLVAEVLAQQVNAFTGEIRRAVMPKLFATYSAVVSLPNLLSRFGLR